MENQRLSAVVFDCDGVLIESNDVKTLAFGRTVEAHGPEAMERLMDYHRMHGGISRFRKFEWFYSDVLRTPLSGEMMDALCNRFTRACIDGVLAAPMVAGAQACLDLLDGQLPMFVASGTPQDELRFVLGEKGLSGYFRGIHGTPPEKQYLLEGIIRDNGLEASTVLMVGDATTDLEAAQHCRTLFYGRGESFRDDHVPWDEDLTGLAEYLSGRFGL